MPKTKHPPEPRTIDREDEDQLLSAAEEMAVRPELVREAVDKVGCNRTAVELYLAAPKA